MMHLDNLSGMFAAPILLAAKVIKWPRELSSVPFCSAILVAVSAFGTTGCSPREKSAEVSQMNPEVMQGLRPDTPVLILLNISPEARVKATANDIPTHLSKGEWSEYLIEIENNAGITAPLLVESEQSLQSSDDLSRDRWFELLLEPNQPLSGNLIEYRTLKIRSRDAGIRTAILNFNAGQGTQDLGFRSDVLVAFKIEER
jgi:hypothetical protein